MELCDENVEWEEDPLEFVFNDEIPGQVRMHTKPLNLHDWIRIDRTYVQQMELKERLLRTQLNDVFITSQDDVTTQAKWELFETLCAYLPERFEYIFEKHSGYIFNKVSREKISTQVSDDLDPLVRCGKLTQEDWIIMKWDEEKKEYILTAGCVCFPMRWVLKEKLNHNIAQLHAPVKGFLKHLLSKVNSLLRNMKPDKPLTRGNWVLLNDLKSPMDLYTPVNPKEVNEPSHYKGDPTGRELIFRSEYQTLRKLPRSQCIAFSLRTYQRYLEEFQNFSDTDCRGLIDALESIDSDFYEYKALFLWKDAAVMYLKSILTCRAQNNSRKWFLYGTLISAGVAAGGAFLWHRITLKQ